MSDLPSWVYDLVIEMEEQRDSHPTLYFTSGAFEGYARYDWCPCSLLNKVPADVVREARVIRDYVRSTERSQGTGTDRDKTTLPASTSGSDPRAETEDGGRQ